MSEHRLEVYVDAADAFRWRKVAANGRIVADSGEGYTRRGDVVEAAFAANPELGTLDVVGGEGPTVTLGRDE